MNSIERKRLTDVVTKASKLLDLGPLPSGNIRDIHVLEAVLADVVTVMAGREPGDTHSLLSQDTEERKRTR